MAEWTKARKTGWSLASGLLLTSLAGAQGAPCTASFFKQPAGSPNAMMLGGAGPGAPLGEDAFGSSITAVGDLNGDGVVDLAVGAVGHDKGGTDRGGIWVLFLDQAGLATSLQEISSIEGGFAGQLDDLDAFGRSVTSLGDLDADGVPEIAVGAPGDDDGADGAGAVWILFLNADGTVKSHQKISATQGGFAGTLYDLDAFGTSVVRTGDVDGDGVPDLTVGAPGDDDGGFDRGAIWTLFLNADGTVRSHQKISATQGGLGPVLFDGDIFGASVGSLGDLDGDTIPDVVVGAPGTDSGGTDLGAVWILFLSIDGTIASARQLGSPWVALLNGDAFGTSVTGMGDMDQDGVVDLTVGEAGDDDGGQDRGAVWILHLEADGDIKSQAKISDTQGHFTPGLDDGDGFGGAIAGIGDLDGDGQIDLAVGVPYSDLDGPNMGSTWVIFLGDAPIYGCGLNPEGSLRVLSGVPKIGTTVEVGLDNPVGSQSIGSLTFLGISTEPLGNFPCGLPLGGWGMDPQHQNTGELLISPASGDLIQPLLVGEPWEGAGNPASLEIPFPDNVDLIGMTVYGQGLVLDPTAAPGERFALTDAIILPIH